MKTPNQYGSNSSIHEHHNSVNSVAAGSTATCDGTCGATRRHAQRGKRISRGVLDPTSPVVAARLRDEGVPPSDIREVAVQLKRVLRFATSDGEDVAWVRVHPWVHELIERYGDKLETVLMTTRGKVNR